jgi:hypothetical protein
VRAESTDAVTRTRTGDARWPSSFKYRQPDLETKPPALRVLPIDLEIGDRISDETVASRGPH